MDNLVLRTLTGVVLAPFTLFVTYVGGLPLLGVLLLVTMVGTLEFYHMEKQRYTGANTALGFACAFLVVLAFYAQQSSWWIATLVAGAVVTLVLEYVRSRDVAQSLFRVITTLGGVVYLAVPTGCLLAIRAMGNDGIWWLYAVFLATWGTDTIAYFVGRKFGKTPLAPKLSPKKTVEGAIGGWVAGVIVPSFFLASVGLHSWSALILLAIAPLAGIWGDLFESNLKRFFGLKDSGIRGFNLFPGHGGVLDRVDGLVWITTLFYIFLLLEGKVGF